MSLTSWYFVSSSFIDILAASTKVCFNDNKEVIDSLARANIILTMKSISKQLREDQCEVLIFDEHKVTGKFYLNIDGIGGKSCRRRCPGICVGAISQSAVIVGFTVIIFIHYMIVGSCIDRCFDAIMMMVRFFVGCNIG